MDVNTSGQETEGASEMDSHADTTAAGSNMVMLTDPEEVTHFVDVAPFSEDYAPIKGIPIASCATAWTNPDNGQVYTCLPQNALLWEQASTQPDMSKPDQSLCISPS